mgnify:CR=1 FL=1
MAYTIYKSNGAAITISDNTFNDDLDLRLVGKNRTGYGAAVNQNFVRLLENFSNGTAPNNPTAGQLWWDSSNNTLKVWNGAWKTVSGMQVSNSQPSLPAVGNFWYDTLNEELKFWNGTLWQTVAGDEITAINITATANVTALDVYVGSHVTVGANLMAGNINNVSGILSVTGNANVGNIGATNANITSMTATGAVNMATTSGNVGIGTASPTYTLDVTGNIRATSTVYAANFDNVSDVSLKSNIEPLANSLDILTKLTPVSFDWIKTGEKQFGLIAQEVEKVLPEIVKYQASDGVKSVSYIQLIAFLIAAVQDLKKQIDDINNRAE